MTKFFKKCKKHHFAHFLSKTEFSSKFCSYQFFSFWLSIIVRDFQKSILQTPNGLKHKHEFMGPFWLKPWIQNVYFSYFEQCISYSCFIFLLLHQHSFSLKLLFAAFIYYLNFFSILKQNTHYNLTLNNN